MRLRDRVAVCLLIAVTGLVGGIVLQAGAKQIHLSPRPNKSTTWLYIGQSRHGSEHCRANRAVFCQHVLLRQSRQLGSCKCRR